MYSIYNYYILYIFYTYIIYILYISILYSQYRALLQYTQQRHLLKLSNLLSSFYSHIEIEEYFLSMIKNIHLKPRAKSILKLSEGGIMKSRIKIIDTP